MTLLSLGWGLPGKALAPVIGWFKGWEWSKILQSLQSLRFRGKGGSPVVPKDWGRILLGKHGPRAGDKKGPGLSYLTCGMKQCLPAFRNDKVPLASADGGGVPALHVGEVPGPRVHTSHAGRLEPALPGRGAGHESRLGRRIRGAAPGGLHLAAALCLCLPVPLCLW